MYPDSELQKLGAQGFAFTNADGTYSYPIANEEDLRNAITGVAMTGADYDAVRIFVMRRARDLGLLHMIPVTWKPDGSVMSAAGTTDGRAEAPRDSLVRAWHGEDALSLRDAEGSAEGSGNLLVGHFAVYNRWTEINSQYEGHFMERVAPGAFDRSLGSRNPKVLFNHGKDPSIGNKPLGQPRSLDSDSIGARYAVDLFDASYVNDLKPALRAGVLGSSFRFGVPDDGDEWNHPTVRSDANPDALPERTLTNVDLYEFGPVTFPAYGEATAGLRSLTDDFVERMFDDPLFLARLIERAGAKNVIPILEAARGAAGEDDGEHNDSERGAADTETDTVNLAERRAFLARML